jgi:hypothetical protein
VKITKIDYKRDGMARTKESNLIGFGEIEIVEVIRSVEDTRFHSKGSGNGKGCGFWKVI